MIHSGDIKMVRDETLRDLDVLNRQEVLRSVIEFAGRKLKGIMDDEGKPIILHYLTLMDIMSKYNDPDLAITTLLYGVGKHTDLSSGEIMSLGVSDETANSLHVLINTSGFSTENHLDAIAHYRHASLVKLEDCKMSLDHAQMMHNHPEIEITKKNVAFLQQAFIKHVEG